MTEYRIVAKIDPAGVSQGRAKIRQELSGLDADVQRTAARGAKAIDEMTAAEFRAAGGVEGLTKAYKNKAAAQAQVEAATKRVLNSVDQEAAAQQRINSLLKDAKVAYDAGRISLEQYNRVQKLAADGAANVAGVTGRIRAGFTQLSFQLGDISQQYALGTKASTIFAQQSGQVIQALQIMGGQGNKFLQFLDSAWGVGITTAAVVLLPLIANMIHFGDAVDDEVDKLKKDAEQTEAERKAKEIFANTLEGVTQAMRRNEDAIKGLLESDKTAARRALEDAIAQNLRLKGIRATTAALLDQTEAQLRANEAFAAGSTVAPGAALAQAQHSAAIQGRVDALRKSLTDTDAAIAKSNDDIQNALSARMQELAKANADPLEGIRQKYEGPGGLIDQAAERARAEGRVNQQYGEQLKLFKQMNAELEKARQALHNRDNSGVALFRSRQQAIGIAGRELQSVGLRVGENVQFGGVTANHPGMGKTAHGLYAIDVNSGAGVTEANVPDLRSRFDQLARSYQGRGYRVLWNGKVYEANGNGPTRPIPPGQDQHHDHMHIEAPATIVGKPTQDSTFEQEQREYKAQQTIAEQKSDFIAGIVNKAAVAGQPKDRATQLKDDIAATLAEYQRRFNQAASPAEVSKITGALTDADAREQAEHFREAYQYPIEDLQIALGKTGLAREIYIKTLEEERRKGAPLTDVEKGMIENSVKMTDIYQREQSILEALNRPLEDYRQQLAALVDLLDKGQISQTQFNARVGELNAPVRQALANAPGDFGQPGGVNIGGRNYSNFADASAAAEENARYAAELDQYQTYREQLQAMGINFDALEEAAHQRHVDNLNAIDLARQQTQLQAGQQIADSLAHIAADTVGKQSAAYRVLFAISKAFTIAQASLALYQNVAKAMSIGFPQNIPFIAAAFAQAATIISAIKGIAVPNTGYMAGGYTGDIGRNQEAGVVHGQEFVVNAEATSRHRALLEAINSGRLSAQARRVSNDNGGGVGGAPVRVTVQNYAPGVEFDAQPGLTPGEVVVIARRVTREEAPGAVASDMARPNGRTSKALGQHFGVGRRRA